LTALGFTDYVARYQRLRSFSQVLSPFFPCFTFHFLFPFSYPRLFSSTLTAFAPENL
jgi:hypothetical protein